MADDAPTTSATTAPASSDPLALDVDEMRAMGYRVVISSSTGSLTCPSSPSSAWGLGRTWRH